VGGESGNVAGGQRRSERGKLPWEPTEGAPKGIKFLHFLMNFCKTFVFFYGFLENVSIFYEFLENCNSFYEFCKMFVFFQ